VVVVSGGGGFWCVCVCECVCVYVTILARGMCGMYSTVLCGCCRLLLYCTGISCSCGRVGWRWRTLYGMYRYDMIWDGDVGGGGRFPA